VLDKSIRHCRSVVVVIADQSEMWHGQLTRQASEQPELLFVGILHVVANELHEVRSKQSVHFLHNLAGNQMVFEPRGG
jgi:hypothetical protein